MPTGVRSRYHIAINNIGFMLRGAPQNPAYSKEDIPTQAGSVLASDAGYDQLAGNGWKYWAQTDWSGGFQQLKWKDDATFRDGQGVDVLSEFGKVTLQNSFTSAVSISGSHSYGSHNVHDGDLILGTIKAGTAKIFKITSAHTVSTLSAYAGISAANSMSRFGNDTLIGLTRTSGTLKTLAAYRNGVISGFRNTNPIVRAVKGIGIRAYIAERIASLSGDRLSYATNLSAFTSAYNAGKNRKIQKIEDLNGAPYFFVEDGRKVEMFKWDEFAERAFPIYTWDDLTQWGVTKVAAALLVITGKVNGVASMFAFNGARLWQIFDDQLDDSSYDFSKPFEFDGNLQTKGAQWDGAAFVPGLYGKFANVQYTPFANFANRAYGYAPTGSLLKLAYYDSTKYQVSGHVVGSNFGHQIGAVEKLVNMATVNCEALATGETIELYRSTNEGSSYTSIGKLQRSVDGAITSKDLYFPSGFVAKTWLYKAQLVGPGTSTPTLVDVSFQYRPVPHTKRRWGLVVDAGDNVKLLNGQTEQRDGKSLVSDLWLEKQAKRTVIFEDVDALSAKVVSAFNSAHTSARVNNTRLFPRKGRIRIISAGVVEEMTYTTADGGSIKGISRAQKGTRARTYPVATQIDNYYTVIVTDVREQINNTDDKTTESIARVTLLEV